MRATLHSAGGRVAVVVAMVSSLVAPARADCPTARIALTESQFPEAIASARACLDQRPGDVATWFELSRALAATGAYEESLDWSSKALALHPQDMDWLAHHIRVLTWKGELETAWSYVARLTDAAFADPETSRLVANLAFWREDWAQAATRSSVWMEAFGQDSDLLRNRGLSYYELDQPERALKDLAAACDISERHCDAFTALRKRMSPFVLAVHPYLTLQAADWIDGNTADIWPSLAVELHKRHRQWLVFGARLEMQRRPGGSWYLTEGFGTLHLPGRWVLGARAGTGLDAPLRYTVQAELGHALRNGLEGYARLWRLQYDGADAVTIVSPALFYVRPGYELRVRYYLGLHAERTTHAVSGAGFYVPWKDWRFKLGAGVGQGTDFVDILHADRIEDYWTLSTGVSWPIGWRQTGAIDYQMRRGTAADLSTRRHRIDVNYAVRF